MPPRSASESRWTSTGRCPCSSRPAVAQPPVPGYFRAQSLNEGACDILSRDRDSAPTGLRKSLDQYTYSAGRMNVPERCSIHSARRAAVMVMGARTE